MIDVDNGLANFNGLLDFGEALVDGLDAGVAVGLVNKRVVFGSLVMFSLCL